MIAIAAMSENRVIGRGLEIPWHLPEDFKWFKKKTMGHVIVMGRKTFQSIGRPLPGRVNVVLSRSGVSAPGIEVVSSVDELMERYGDREIFVCGGAEVYRLTLPNWDELFLTHVHRVVEGDIFFPRFEDRFILKGIAHADPDFTVKHYVKKVDTDRNFPSV